MNIVIDASALPAVIVREPEHDRIIASTSGLSVIGHGAIPREVGNAFSVLPRSTMDSGDKPGGVIR